MVQREEDVGLAQPRGDVEDVPPQRLHVAVQRLGHAVDAEVHLDAGVGQPARHLLADDDVGSAGTRDEQLERAVDRVVIGDGDEIHAARLGDAVDVLGRRVAVAAAEKRQRAADLRVAGVDVEIGAEHRSVIGAASAA